jgi:hypothetical protein
MIFDEKIGTDQMTFWHLILNGSLRHLIKVETDAQLFGSMLFTDRRHYDIRSRSSPNKSIYNIATGSYPSFLHFNGPSKPTLKHYASAMPFSSIQYHHNDPLWTTPIIPLYTRYIRSIMRHLSFFFCFDHCLWLWWYVVKEH